MSLSLMCSFTESKFFYVDQVLDTRSQISYSPSIHKASLCSELLYEEQRKGLLTSFIYKVNPSTVTADTCPKGWKATKGFPQSLHF